MKDHYATLGVAVNSTASEIRKAYRRLALKHHPDRNAGDRGAERRFKEIAEAYDILSDSAKRAKYDAERAGAPRPTVPLRPEGTPVPDFVARARERRKAGATFETGPMQAGRTYDLRGGFRPGPVPLRPGPVDLRSMPQVPLWVKKPKT